MRHALPCLALTILALGACAKPGGAPDAANAAMANAAPPAATPVPTANPAPASDDNVALGTNPAAPGANGPPGPSTVEIKFQRGASCWRYVGVASTFNGKFAAGQRLDVTSTGEQQNGDGQHTWFETRPRNVDVAAPGGQLLQADSNGYFDVPASGAYQISFDPMSMVGGPGVMMVCTL